VKKVACPITALPGSLLCRALLFLLGKALPSLVLSSVVFFSRAYSNPVPVPDGFDVETKEGTIRVISVDSVEFIPSGSQNTIAEKGSAPIPKGKDDVPTPSVNFEDPPVPMEMPRPEYPTEAKKSRIQGKAFVQALVDLDGSVVQTRIAKSSGNAALDSAAVRGARKFRFKPAKMHKKPVRVWVSIPVEFRLKD